VILREMKIRKVGTIRARASSLNQYSQQYLLDLAMPKKKEKIMPMVALAYDQNAQPSFGKITL